LKPAAQSAPSRETLVGSVERVTFHNEENGFAVLKVKARGAVEGAGTFRSKKSAWFSGSLVRGAKIGARTTRSPAHRGASPWAALTRPAPKSGWRVQRNFVSVFRRLEAMHMKCMLWFESRSPSQLTY
jgi:hypothetical protein